VSGARLSEEDSASLGVHDPQVTPARSSKLRDTYPRRRPGRPALPQRDRQTDRSPSTREPGAAIRSLSVVTVRAWRGRGGRADGPVSHNGSSLPIAVMAGDLYRRPATVRYASELTLALRISRDCN
jgi:hypothetical protein